MDIVRRVLSTRRGRIAASLLVLLAVPGLALAWWLGSPLFLNVTDVTEKAKFPLAIADEEVVDHTQAEIELITEGMAKPDSEIMEEMPAGIEEAVILRSGAFHDIGGLHKGSGAVTIYALPDGEHLLRLEELRVTNGPNLHVILAMHPDPRYRFDVEEGGYRDLGGLKGNVGNQNYPIPTDLDLSSYRAVVIYSLPFHIVFGVAPLGAGG